MILHRARSCTVDNLQQNVKPHIIFIWPWRGLMSRVQKLQCVGKILETHVNVRKKYRVKIFTGSTCLGVFCKFAGGFNAK